MGALQVNYRMFVDVRNENTGKIVAKQNDTKTRYLDITVTDNGVPVDLTGCEVRIYGRKKDGKEFYNDGTLQDAENGRCLFEATTQMLAYAGQNVNCEIVVFKDNEQILSTMPFDIFVVESLMGASAIESSNEYGALVILYQNLYEAIDLMTTMVQNIGSPSTVAEQYNLETMWQAWEFLTDYMKTDLTQMIENALANSSVQGVLDMLDTTTAKERTSQEILEKAGSTKGYGAIFTVKPQSAVGTHELLNISGSGMLVGCYLCDNCALNASTTTRFKIEIDEEIIYDVSVKRGTSSNSNVYARSFLVIDPKNFTGNSTSNVFGEYISNSSSGVINISPDNQVFTGSSNNSYFGLTAWVNGGICFEKSLKITTTHNVASNCLVWYTLDE